MLQLEIFDWKVMLLLFGLMLAIGVVWLLVIGLLFRNKHRCTFQCCGCPLGNCCDFNDREKAIRGEKFSDKPVKHSICGECLHVPCVCDNESLSDFRERLLNKKRS